MQEVGDAAKAGKRGQRQQELWFEQTSKSFGCGTCLGIGNLGDTDVSVHQSSTDEISGYKITRSSRAFRDNWRALRIRRNETRSREIHRLGNTRHLEKSSCPRLADTCDFFLKKES